MAQFVYTALKGDNSYARGTTSARSQKQATQLLEKQGLLVINIAAERKRPWDRFNVTLSGVSALDRIFFTRNLQTMLEAGIGLDQAVKTTAEQITNKKFQAILVDMYTKIRAGQPLYRTLSEHKEHFSEFYISLIRVGESSGKLDTVLVYLLEQQEKDYALRTKAKGAMIYPSLIVTALIIMVSAMMIFVVPKVTGVLTQYHVQLPLATRILVAISWFLTNFWYIVFPGLVLIVVLFRAWIKRPKGKKRWDAFLLGLPLINKIVAELNLARFTRSMSALLHSGVALDQALSMSATVCSNTAYQVAIKRSIGFVQKGVPLGEVIKGYPRLFPPLAYRMIEVGGKSGKLDHMLERLAAFYEKSVDTDLGNISSVIEPVLLLLIGTVVGYVAVAVITPVWKFSATI